MAKKVADQLVDTLEKAGVRRIYAVTGDSLNEVNEAVRKNGRLRWIHVRHEETGAYAAAAEAQLTGELACCAGSSGPGHVHLINGLYDAQRSWRSLPRSLPGSLVLNISKRQIRSNYSMIVAIITK